MRIRSIFLYLLGDRESILELAHSRWTLLVGALLVLSAGLARNYDGEDLAREPWHLLGPFGASIVTSIGLFMLFMALATTRDPRRAGVWARWRLYPGFLSLYWMTAPLAWLYGIPYERFLTPSGAVEANMWTLAAVAAWRVLLMARVVSLLLRTSFFPVLVWTAFYGAVLMFAAVLISPKPILDIMGGLHLPPEDRVLKNMMANLGCSSFVAIPVLLILGIVMMPQFNPLWPPPKPATARSSALAGLLVAGVTVIAWIPALVVAQPEQRLRRSVELAMLNGEERSAVAIMSAHARIEFPPHWRPPPLRGWRNSPGSLRKIRAAIEADGAPGWVVEHYVDETREWAGNRFYWAWSDPPKPWPDQMVAWVASFESRPVPGLRTTEAIQFLLRHDRSVTPEQRSKVEAILIRPGFVSPDGDDRDW